MNDQIRSLLRRAETLCDQGRRPDAIAAYRQLLDINPELPDCWYNLGYLLKLEGEFDDALEAYARALTHGVEGPEEVHLNRAVICSDHLRRDAEAERELRTALELAPGYVPALLNLGNLHEERGDRDAAIDCYRRLLSAPEDGGHRELRFEALARMAHLRPPADTGDSLLEQLRRAAAGTRDPAVRANLLFALGRALDALAAHSEAFAAFSEGNTCARATGGGYDRERSERKFDALIANFPAPESESPANGAEPAPPGPEPMFICGMFRSGSTLLERVLAAHPQVTPGEELDLLPRMVRGPLAPFPDAMSALSRERAAQLADAYRKQLSELFPDASESTYISDKRPDNFLLVGLIHRLFPAARIIHTTRDPMDNGLSLFMQHLDPRVAPYSLDLGDIGHYYGQYRRLMAHWQRLFPANIHDFDYDAFVREPEPQLARLFEFLELEWDERCLEFHRAGGTVKTASYWQVRRPLYGDASGRWRRYREELKPLRRALAEAGVHIPAGDL